MDTRSPNRIACPARGPRPTPPARNPAKFLKIAGDLDREVVVGGEQPRTYANTLEYLDLRALRQALR